MTNAISFIYQKFSLHFTNVMKIIHIEKGKENVKETGKTFFAVNVFSVYIKLNVQCDL